MQKFCTSSSTGWGLDLNGVTWKALENKWWLWFSAMLCLRVSHNSGHSSLGWLPEVQKEYLESGCNTKVYGGMYLWTCAFVCQLLHLCEHRKECGLAQMWALFLPFAVSPILSAALVYIVVLALIGTKVWALTIFILIPKICCSAELLLLLEG